jgi:hypothetical protein
MRGFDPHKLGLYEKDNWVAYYQKRWFKLLRVSVGMVKEGFGLSWWQALYGAYLVARAEIAAAPVDNNIPRAERYMRRFYSMVRRAHRERFDVDEAARLDVRWWVIHRRLFGQRENGALVDALTDLYATVYMVEPNRVRLAAFHRAEAMLYSDCWVNEGRAGDSPLLTSVEEELVKSYAALSRVVAPEE